MLSFNKDSSLKKIYKLISFIHLSVSEVSEHDMVYYENSTTLIKVEIEFHHLLVLILNAELYVLQWRLIKNIYIYMKRTHTEHYICCLSASLPSYVIEILEKNVRLLISCIVNNHGNFTCVRHHCFSSERGAVKRYKSDATTNFVKKIADIFQNNELIYIFIYDNQQALLVVS